MAEQSGTIKLLLGVGVVLFLLWFLTFSLAPASILTKLAFVETEGFFLRMFGIFPLGWAVLFLFARKDATKNIAIIKSSIITAAFLIVAFLIYHFAVENLAGWFLWLSMAVLFIFNMLLFIFKPKSA